MPGLVRPSLTFCRTAAFLCAALAICARAFAGTPGDSSPRTLGEAESQFSELASQWTAHHEQVEASRRWVEEAERRGWTLAAEPGAGVAALETDLRGQGSRLHRLSAAAPMIGLLDDLRDRLNDIFAAIPLRAAMDRTSDSEAARKAAVDHLKARIAGLIEKVEADEVLVRELAFRVENLGTARLPPPALRSADRSALSAGERLPGAETRGFAAGSSGTTVKLGLPELSKRTWGPRAQKGLMPALDKIEAGGLTPVQEEALVRAQPMGELIWSMQAHKLWEKGLDGRGVKVAVIDAGIGVHPGVEAVVRREAGSLPEALNDGDHGMKVAGVIHALAPRAEIRLYKIALSVDQLPGAVDRAVRDGSQIVDMSLGRFALHPALHERLSRHAAAGVIFVGSAGNAGAKGMLYPASDPAALAVGALDRGGRMADFSSYGSGFDARGGRTIVRELLMAPGVDVMVPFLRPPTGDAGYASRSGTSYAAPAVAGALAQLLPAGRGVGALVTRALRETGEELPRAALPKDAPAEQRYIAVRPYDAYRRLVGE